MKRLGIDIGVHGYRLYTQFLAGTDNTERYFTPIGDQYFIKHLHKPSCLSLKLDKST
jgi:hypothetical protein